MEDTDQQVWRPSLLALAAVCTLLLPIFVVKRMRRKRTSKATDFIDVCVDNEKYWTRPLGKMETVFHNLHREGNMQVSMLALTRTSVALNEGVVRKVVDHLRYRHPMLRMRIIDADTKPQFAQGIEETPLEIVYSDDWLEAFENSLEYRLDETRRLWKLTMVFLAQKSDPAKKDGFCQIPFIFTFHHSIGDGLCKSRIITEFVESLNKVLHNRPLDTAQFSLLPPLDTYIPPVLQRTVAEKLFFQVLNAFPASCYLLKRAQNQHLKSVLPKPNAFVEKLGAVCLDDPTVDGKTRVIPLRFTAQETEEILRACRARGATVQGMLTAACSITTGEMFDVALFPEHHTETVQIRTTVNMRRYFDGNVPEEYLGSYFVGLFAQDIPIPRCPSKAEQFWSSARDNTKNLHGQLRNQTFITNFWNLLETVYHSSRSAKKKPSSAPKGPNRTNEVLSLNNYGKCPSRGSASDLVHLTGCFSAISEHKRGPVFSINAVTVEGRLCLSFLYFTNITSKEMACNFANAVKYKILKYRT